MPVEIYDTDTSFETATKIFNSFELHQSCSVIGLVIITEDQEVIPKGEAVIRYLRDLFDAKKENEKGRPKMSYKNAVGGKPAEKIFKWKIGETENKIPKYDFWRAQ